MVEQQLLRQLLPSLAHLGRSWDAKDRGQRRSREESIQGLLCRTGNLPFYTFYLSAFYSFFIGKIGTYNIAYLHLKGAWFPHNLLPSTLERRTVPEVLGLDVHKGGDLHPYLVFC